MDSQDRRRELWSILSTPPFSKMNPEQKLHSLEAAIEAVNQTDSLRALRDARRFGTEGTSMSYTEAREWAERVVEKDLRNLGCEHEITLEDQYVLADLFLHTGEFCEARELFEQVYAQWSDRWGADHRKTLCARQGEADALAALRRYGRARRTMEQVLERRSAVFGELDPDTLASAHSLAALLARQGRRKEARVRAETVLAMRRKVLGEKHPDTLASSRMEAELRMAGAPLEEAEEEYGALFDRFSDLLGSRHPETLAAAFDYGRCLYAHGHYDAAAVFLSRCSQARVEISGYYHPDTLRTMRMEARSWGRVGKKDVQKLRREIVVLIMKERLRSRLLWPLIRFLEKADRQVNLWKPQREAGRKRRAAA